MNHDDTKLLKLIEDVNELALTMEAVAAHISSDAPILLIAPRSTGSQLFAEAIHACSKRSERPFIRARCGLYSGMLLEAQLFGKSNVNLSAPFLKSLHKRGMVEKADGGSLFIEQIQNTTSSIQTILFDVIANKEYLDFERASIHHADVRIIASSRFGLEKSVRTRKFFPYLFAQFESHTVKLNTTCESRERILAVIDLLRTDASSQRNKFIEQETSWWIDAARSATQSAASQALRNAVKAVMQQHVSISHAESVFFAALHYLCFGNISLKTSPSSLLTPVACPP